MPGDVVCNVVEDSAFEHREEDSDNTPGGAKEDGKVDGVQLPLLDDGSDVEDSNADFQRHDGQAVEHLRHDEELCGDKHVVFRHDSVIA